MPEELLNYSHLARVIPAKGERLEEIRSLIDGDTPSDELFLWDAEISNDLLDSHFTHMSESTLGNYASDAEKGVAFLKGHDWRSLPIGYSVSGELEETSKKKRVVAGFYTIRGLADTDDLIRRMQGGLVRDVSVGFHGGRMVCDLCGQDFWDCRHFPGLKYETKEGDTVKTELATFTIEDANLSEVSGVFDGSTPEAMILKAQRFAKTGRLTRMETEILGQQYRIKLPDNYKSVGVSIPKENKKMDEKDLERVRKAVVGIGGFTEETARSLDETSVVGTIETLSQVVRNMQPATNDGIQYRKDLVAEALAEGVRAQGADFDSVTYQTVLESSPLAVVKRMKEDWKKVADKVLPAGRASVNGDERTKESKKTVESHIGDEAYA